MNTESLAILIDRVLKTVLFTLIIITIFISIQLVMDNLNNNPEFFNQLPAKLASLLRQLPRLNG
ncbi:hypothetical protein MWH28_07780 [Natroniella sulfidigena]|uniref:hypothetical protein n=1 Tax=Natroniella sulfidigena TaxID=723921 RepID=UPI00200B5D02|nr:hypothetical protein [Natroniella sulfidigena]MCK8817259.1 hypothetical protein [Natroniella sulfidigena]